MKTRSGKKKSTVESADRLKDAATSLGKTEEISPMKKADEEEEEEQDNNNHNSEASSEGEEEDEKHDEIQRLLKKGTKKKTQQKLDTVTSNEGVIYLGRIPHGFYEEQMMGFFDQFGTVKRMRLSRSRKTGRSRGYAFIQFESAQVAEIVAKAMDQYILMDKVLQCSVVPPENVHEKLFLGEHRKGRNYKTLNPAMKDLKKHGKVSSEDPEKLKKRVRGVNSRLQERSKRLKSKGIDYEFKLV